MKNKLVTTVGLIAGLYSQNIAITSDGDVYQIWDTGQTLMFESIDNGSTIEIMKETNVQSSYNNGRTSKNNRQVWEDPTKWKEFTTTGLFESPHKECRICNPTRSDTLDLSRGRIRQD
tara:strand:- start:4869 stop:5222 length:354 start_codon:yes stop_codon:yes gene_type:complete